MAPPTLSRASKTSARIAQHGDQAALQAAMQSDALLEAGDMDGAATWRKVIAAIEILQPTEPVGTTH